MTLAAALMTFATGDRQRIEQLGRLARVHRVDAFSRSRRLATVRPVVDLDVDVRVAPRPTEALREQPADRRLAGAHEPGDDDVAARSDGSRRID